VRSSGYCFGSFIAADRTFMGSDSFPPLQGDGLSTSTPLPINVLPLSMNPGRLGGVQFLADERTFMGSDNFPPLQGDGLSTSTPLPILIPPQSMIPVQWSPTLALQCVIQ
jgi:hypothetical protein